MLLSAISQPVYGCFPRWPADGTSWIHPDDVEMAVALIPSDRIFRRQWDGGEYSQLIYGQQTIRAKPTLWHVVSPGKFEVGEIVEIRSQMGERQPGLAVVREVLWNRHIGAAWYELEQRETILPDRFDETQLRAVEELQEAGGLLTPTRRGT